MKSSQENVKSCLLAVGANLSSQAGSVERNVRVALELIAQEPLLIDCCSRLFKTPAFPKGAGPDFVNAALKVQTSLGADELLARLHGIENRLGRRRKHRWEARVLDIDLLSFGDEVLPDRQTHDRWRRLSEKDRATRTPDRLIVPHPRLQERGFVLVPLMDIAPDWVHPVLGLTVRQMHARLGPQELDEIDAL